MRDMKELIAPIATEDLDSVDALLDVLSPLNARWSRSRGDWVFRGHGSSDWILKASALRPETPIRYGRHNTDLPTRVYSQQIEIERDYFWEFFHAINRQGLPLPGMTHQILTPAGFDDLQEKASLAMDGTNPWPPYELLAAFALAQHYGVPTRLLDWSENSLVAAYFAAVYACQMQVLPKRAAIWALNRRFLYERWPTSERHNMRVYAVSVPRAENPNLHAQSGVFTVEMIIPGIEKLTPVRDLVPLDRVIEAEVKTLQGGGSLKWFEDHDVPVPVMWKFEFPGDRCGELLKVLADLNVHAGALYPGYRGAVRSLEERRLWP